MNASVVGRTYPSVTFEITEERVRGFARAVGAEGDAVPPTFATVPEMAALAQVIADPELELDFSRVLHGEQEYEWRRPLALGETLRLAPRIAAIREKGGTGFLVVESEARDASGEVAVVARSTLIERGVGS